ncbi:response regulator transcription factor [bacterium]|nr:MAG: response regulator transcription factor [bacterium]
MSQISCIIVEDEPLAVKILTDYVRQVPFLALKGTFKNALLAIDFLKNHKIDLILLDIHLPKMKGFQFLKTLPSPPSVIVTTAYHQYAIEGFDLNVTDYLLKPFEFERFVKAVNKVKGKLETAGNPGTTGDYFFLTVSKKKVKLAFVDIVYVESQREYVKVVTHEKAYLSKISTHEIEKLLPANLFKRVHRSYIISTKWIKSYTFDQVDVDGVSIPIGRNYKHVTDEF